MPTIAQEAAGWNNSSSPDDFAASHAHDPDAQGPDVGLSDGEMVRPLNPEQPAQRPDSGQKPDDLEAGYLRQQDYTRKTQELAEQRRQLEQERQRIYQLQQQMADALKNLQSGTPKEQAAAQRFLDSVPGLREKLDPMAATTFDAWDSYTQQLVQKAVDAVRQEMGQTIQTHLTPVQQQSRAMAIKQEVDQLQSQYGQDIVPYLQDPTVQGYVSRGATFSQAIALANPNAFYELGMRKGQAALTRTRKQQANLEGGFPSPSASPIPEFDPDEDMAASFAAAQAELASRGVRPQG